MMCRNLITFINQIFMFCDESQSFRRLLNLEYERCPGCVRGIEGNFWMDIWYLKKKMQAEHLAM